VRYFTKTVGGLFSNRCEVWAELVHWRAFGWELSIRKKLEG